MARREELPLTYRSLFEGPVVSLRDYDCRAGRGGPAAEEYSGSNNVVLMRHGAFCKHFGRRGVTADVNQAVFFSQGSTYRVSHPADCGDRGTVLVAAAPVLHDLVRRIDPAREAHPERPFPFITGPCETGVVWRHRELVRRLEAAAPDPLWVEETALQLLADVLRAAFARHGQPRRRHRPATGAAHADLAEAAKAYLAARLGERITLAGVARAVHAAPFHLARVFRQHTGLPVHRYLTRLRLRAALERLAGGATDLTAAALDLGFSSHSHFTDAFRREFGRTPSAGRRMFHELSKNLKV